MKPQPWLAPLVPLYRMASGTRNAAYDRGLLTARRLQSPVVSVGNLSTGGSGKTPLVIALAQLLTSAGISVDVLSRGYGRSGTSVEHVDLNQPDAAERYGDEPVLIARAANVPVFVGASRFAAGSLAEQTPSASNHLHLLDDGFQHRELARDLDIVVMHRSDIHAHLLPAGHLREPLSSLQRAHVAVLREEDRDLAPTIAEHLRPGAHIWYVQRTLTCEVTPGPAVAFSGIGRPEEFFAGLRALGMRLATTVAYPDHHPYNDQDLQNLLATVREKEAAQLITTEKDATRLTPRLLTHLSASVLVAVAKLEVRFLEVEQVLATVRALLAMPGSTS